MRKKKKNKIITSVITVFVVALIATVGFFINKANNRVYNFQKSNEVVVSYLDVGQGDSEFIQLPNGKCMLIDAGNEKNASEIIHRISGLGYTKIDYLVATHPHADHIGGMREIIENFEIGKIYMPRVTYDSETYEKLLFSVMDKNLSINDAKAGDIIYKNNDLLIEILSPLSTSYDEINNFSAVIRLKYGNNTFLFMGDAEETVERDILRSYSAEKLKADVLKVGHHGSDTSSSLSFINTVLPDYAVIEVGKGNKYNHPNYETINTLSLAGAEILRTDAAGNIYMISDKNNIKVVCEKD